jgi:tetratricopeptide (TPR) repeat protein
MAQLSRGVSASALWTRAAAAAEVAGDAVGAAAYARAAAENAVDDPGAIVRAAEIEIPPDLAPDEVSGYHLARAKLAGRRAGLCRNADERSFWELEQADALERTGRLADAGAAVARVLRERPGHLRALESLRRLARAGDDRVTLARADIAYGLAIGDAERALELFREAALILDVELGDREAAVPVYRRILALDPFSPAFDRLRAIYGEAGDPTGLYELLSNRLDALDDETERAPLRVDRARLRLSLGDDRGATRDLALALEGEPENLAALRLQAALLARLGAPKEAATLLRRYLELETATDARAAAEVDLSQLLAEADDFEGAVARLEAALAATPDDLGLRDQLVSLALRSGDAARAVDELRKLSRQRTSPPDRARDELRIAEIARDHLGDHARARKALERARELDPLNLEIVKALAELVGPGERADVLAQAAADARHAIAQLPALPAPYAQLARIADWMGDADARMFAIAAVEALGTASSEQRRFAAEHAARLRRVPSDDVVLSRAEWQQHLAHPQSCGPTGDIWAAIADAVLAVIPHEPEQLGFAKADRVPWRCVADLFPMVARLVQVFGIADEIELYVRRDRRRYARVYGCERRVMLVGDDVARGREPSEVFLLGRAIAMLRDGTGPLIELGHDDLIGFVAAAAREAGADPAAIPPLAGATGAAQTAREQTLAPGLSRQARKVLAGLVARAGAIDDPGAWRRAALATAARAGLAVAGDLAAALAVLDRGRAVADDSWTLDLVAWAASEHCLAIRRRMGLGT